MKYILVPDSFKGTMSSLTICGIMRSAILSIDPGANVVALPVADGGEGTVDAFLYALGGERRTARVSGPYFEPVDAFYGMSGTTAFIEVASCAGLPLVYGNADPSRTTTFGVGELMLEAVKNGAKRIILGLGGSATNDGGCGAAAAAGITFLDETGERFIPAGGSLHRISQIDLSTLSPLLREVEFISMCDIDNPLLGKSGAAHVFAPQKGADAAMVEMLDSGLAHLSRVMIDAVGEDLSLMKGAGAAGGMGFGMAAFFSSKMKMGIDTLLDEVDFDSALKGADMVFTGEGRIDFQSARGKVVSGVAKRAKAHSVPVVAIVGDVGIGADEVYPAGVNAIFSINRVAVPKADARQRAERDMAATVEDIVRLILSVKQ